MYNKIFCVINNDVLKALSPKDIRTHCMYGPKKHQ